MPHFENMTVHLSLAAGYLFTGDKVSKVYVRTFITPEPNAPQRKKRQIKVNSCLLQLGSHFYSLGRYFY